MAKLHVVAYFMHEQERDAAAQALAAPEITDSFVTGDIDEAQIPALEAKGLLVQRQLPRIETAVERGATAFTDAVPAAIDYYLVSLKGPLLEAHREKLAAAGITLGEVTEDGRYKTKLARAQVPTVRALPFVEKISWISPDSSVAQVITESAGGIGEGETLTFDVRVHDPADTPKVQAWLTAQGLAIVGVSTRKLRFLAEQNTSVLDDLAALPEVDKVTEYVQPIAFNDAARRLLGLDAVDAGAVTPVLTQDGTGQLVGIADTGIDDAHPDFQGRIAKKIGKGRPGDASDPNGHGTHVSGSVLGDGAASGGKFKGVAPKATLVFQSLLDDAGHLGGLPVDLNDLFDEAYKAGVRVHNNSWGSPTPSLYTTTSEEVDEFVHANKDMLIVIAAGNSGTSGRTPVKSDPGFVDWLSIGSPASSKNALTVGASRSDRTDGAFSATTWAQGWPNKFPLNPIGKETVSGDPQSLAAFSSRGPCDDRRIKPDLVAPGTDICSTKSSLAPIRNFWGPLKINGAPDPHYAFDGGTSMATPLVTGCAALVRQYYVDSGHAEPSAALLKATLVNSTTWLTGQDATAKSPGKPNFHQGHGRVNMAVAIPNPSQPGMELRFVDDWKTFQFTRTGQRKRYQFQLPADAPELRICLAYTDAPARALQNNVFLTVQHLDSGTKILGNQDLPDKLVLPDPDNNVETVRFTPAKAGTYFIQVTAANLLKPPQDFALVITGAGVPALIEI